MKRLLALSFLIGNFLPFAFPAAPDFSINYRFTNRAGEPTDGITSYSGATRTLALNNSVIGCSGFQLTYNSEGFSVISINLQTNTKVLTGGTTYGPGNSWSTYGGTASTGTLPMTSTSQGTYVGYGYYPYISINLATATGTGSVDVVLSCWKSISYAGAGGAGAGLGIQVDASLIGTRAIENYQTNTGIVFTPTDTGTQINLGIGVDTATVLLKSVDQSNSNKSLTETSASATVYTFTCSPTCIAYTTNMHLYWKVVQAGTGGVATSVNIDGLGVKSLKRSDGSTDPLAAELAAGNLLEIAYDGTVFRLVGIPTNICSFGLLNNSPGTGTCTFLDRTATTGSSIVGFGTDLNGHTSAVSTKVIVTVGAAQSGNPFQVFQNDGSSNLFSISSVGNLTANSDITASSGRYFMADTCMSRNSFGITQFGTNSCGANGTVLLGVMTATGVVTSAGTISASTKFTTSGCSISSTTGGATVGKFTLGANNCTVVITMNGATGLTAPNGWNCSAEDQTALTVLISQSNDSTTTCSINIPVTAGATDVIRFIAYGY